MKSMGFQNAEQRYDVIATMSDRIARDDPHMALEEARARKRAGLQQTEPHP